jgi:hypothetical protein
MDPVRELKERQLVRSLQNETMNLKCDKNNSESNNPDFYIHLGLRRLGPCATRLHINVWDTGIGSKTITKRNDAACRNGQERAVCQQES